MNGTEQPREVQDIHKFLNLVTFAQILLNDEACAHLFRPSKLVFCRIMMSLAQQHTIFSGFLKLLSAAMRVNDGKKPSGMVIDEEQHEISAFRQETRTFAVEIIRRSKGCSDDLEASCYDFVLSVSLDVLDPETQLPALIAALKRGVTYSGMAAGALRCLEGWVERIDEVGHLLPELLPLLDSYLVTFDPDSAASERIGAKSSVRKRKRGLSSVKRQARGNWLDKDAQAFPIRVVQILAKLGTHATSLARIEDGSESTVKLDVSKVLGLKYEFKGTGGGNVECDVKVDRLVARVAHLAETSADRQIKVTAGELLFALMTLAIKNHSESKDEERESYRMIFKGLYPSLMRLSVDGDLVERFASRFHEMIRWFSSQAAKEERSIPDAEHILEAIFDGLGEISNPKLREFASESLLLYADWTLKGLAGSDQKVENGTAVKTLLRRLYGLLSHSDPGKRIGAFRAIERLVVALSREAHWPIADQFLFEMMHSGILSLRAAHDDDPALETEKIGRAALERYVLH
jgi:hypothetical protein